MKSLPLICLFSLASLVSAGPCKNDPADPGCCLQLAEWTGKDGRSVNAPLVYDRSTGAVGGFCFISLIGVYLVNVK
jgi:hypothetical protein